MIPIFPSGPSRPDPRSPASPRAGTGSIGVSSSCIGSRVWSRPPSRTSKSAAVNPRTGDPFRVTRTSTLTSSTSARKTAGAWAVAAAVTNWPRSGTVMDRTPSRAPSARDAPTRPSPGHADQRGRTTRGPVRAPASSSRGGWPSREAEPRKAPLRLRGSARARNVRPGSRARPRVRGGRKWRRSSGSPAAPRLGRGAGAPDNVAGCPAPAQRPVEVTEVTDRRP